MLPSQLVDVLILSYCKTEREYSITLAALDSLSASEESVRFNVVLVETSTESKLNEISDGANFGSRCKVVFPNKPFNYNEFLQIGFREFGRCSAPNLLICNNDVVFQKGFATQLVQALGTFHSVSPWCPGHHEEHFSNHFRYYPGYRTSLELCGWAVMFRRSILQLVQFEQLFPADFEFWFQDNFYGVQLRRHNLTHALVRDAKVVHLFAQSHDLLDAAKKHDARYGAIGVFERKIAQLEERQVRKPILTIAVPSIVSQFGTELIAVIEKLAIQAKGKPVEIIALVDNELSTLDAKRQALVEWAQGEFTAVVEPSDRIMDGYVDDLLAAIRHNAGVERIVVDGHDASKDDATLCFKTELACQVRWTEGTQNRRSDTPNKSFGDASAQHSRHSQPELSICVLTVPSRFVTSFPVIIEKLARQAQGKAVEVLALLDNKCSSIGRKRNLLLSHAKGRFITFVDDDDDIAYDYVTALLEAIHQDPDVDCIVFDAWVTLDGGDGRLCRYGIEYEDHDTPDAYYRKPNHICCLRRDIVGLVPFEDISYHEDFQWAKAIHPRLQRQARIARTLYSYQYSSTGSESRRASSESWLAFAPEIRPVADPLVNGPVSHDNSLRPQDQDRPVNVKPQMSIHPIFGFMHVALMPGWREIVQEQLWKLHASGLYERTQRIFVGLVGSLRNEFDLEDAKLEVVAWNPELLVGESPTLEYLDRFCRGQECLAYYIHTKGVSRDSDTTRDWRHLMEYFVIARHEDCLRRLATHDACGVNWHTHPLPHFSGNFWWTKSSYVRTLPTVQEHADTCSKLSLRDTVVPSWWSCEFWIGANPRAQIAILHESGVNHYEVPYPRSRYSDVRNIAVTSAYYPQTAWRGLENRFQELLEPIGRIRTIVEIGVEFGFSVFCLAAAAPQATVVGIDPYQSLDTSEHARLMQLGRQGTIGSNEAEAWVRQHLPEFGNILLIRARGEEIARCMSGQVDVVHIDAVHTYADVAKEFEAWEPLVRPGGCILFHDTESFPDDVGRFFVQLPGRKAHLSVSSGLGAWYKPISPDPCRTASCEGRTATAECERL
jgi:hypothetical protein